MNIFYIVGGICIMIGLAQDFVFKKPSPVPAGENPEQKNKRLQDEKILKEKEAKQKEISAMELTIENLKTMPDKAEELQSAQEKLAKLKG